MPKEATETKTKTTRKTTSAPAKEGKEKRKPSAYNLFIKANLSKWRGEHPGSEVKEAMAAVAKMWKDAPENPNRGKEAAPKKAPKEKVEKENKKKPSKKAAEEPAAAEGSEASEGGDEE